jgi:hypothetical protein
MISSIVSDWPITRMMHDGKVAIEGQHVVITTVPHAIALLQSSSNINVQQLRVCIIDGIDQIIHNHKGNDDIRAGILRLSSLLSNSSCQRIVTSFYETWQPDYDDERSRWINTNVMNDLVDEKKKEPSSSLSSSSQVNVAAASLLRSSRAAHIVVPPWHLQCAKCMPSFCV